LILFISFLISTVWAAGKGDYLDATVVRSDQRLMELVQMAPGKGKGGLQKWADANLALVALRRMQGRDKEAYELLKKCAGRCRDFGAKGEWESSREWACALGKADSKIFKCQK